MGNYFSGKASYDKMQEDGSIKKVTEEYIIDGYSFTDVEARLTKELKEAVKGDFKISNLSKSKIAEIHDKNGEFWVAVVVEFLMYNEKTNKEIKAPTKMLFSADDIVSVIGYVTEVMKKCKAEWKIISITETKIQSVLNYIPELLEVKSELQKIEIG